MALSYIMSLNFKSFMKLLLAELGKMTYEESD